MNSLYFTASFNILYFKVILLNFTHFFDFIKRFILKNFRLLFLCCILVMTSACVGRIVGEAVDVTIEVVKVPFKVAGAVVDVVTKDD